MHALPDGKGEFGAGENRHSWVWRARGASIETMSNPARRNEGSLPPCRAFLLRSAEHASPTTDRCPRQKTLMKIGAGSPLFIAKGLSKPATGQKVAPRCCRHSSPTKQSEGGEDGGGVPPKDWTISMALARRSGDWRRAPG